MMRDIQKLASARSNFYYFLARMFENEIDEKLLGDLANLTIPQAASDEMQEGYKLMKEGAVGIKSMKNGMDQLAADFAKVFLGAGDATGHAAFPYESVYTGSGAMVMQEATSQMHSLLAADQLALNPAAKEFKEDHITVELMYMAKLVAEKASLQKQQAFLLGHLESWIEAFAKDIESYAETDIYKGLAKLTQAFISEEVKLLEELAAAKDNDLSQSYSLTFNELDRVIAKLSEKYQVYAPKFLAGRSQDNAVVRYQQISKTEEIVYDRPSDYSAKEVYNPVTQTMFYFKGQECQESLLKDDKPLLIFMRPCDVNGMSRLDKIFLKNGNQADMYYERLRNKVKVVLLECSESYDQCFCCSMGTNKVSEDQYDLAVKLSADKAQVKLISKEFEEYFEGSTTCDYQVSFIEENTRKVKLPEIEGTEDVALASKLEYWSKYDDKCISCGGCNTVCPTCSCFDTIDIRYTETSSDGERRRVWSSCMLDTFTMTAGGARARKTAGANMRFKTMHKTYDFQHRFHADGPMCVGCGRCISRCPEDIDFADTVNGFADALKTAKGGR